MKGTFEVFVLSRVSALFTEIIKFSMMLYVYDNFYTFIRQKKTRLNACVVIEVYVLDIRLLNVLCNQ